jgi:hypothetical protein
MPGIGRSVAVAIIKEGGIHIQYPVGEKLINEAGLAGVIFINPLIVPVSDFLNKAVPDKLLNVMIKNLVGIKFPGTEHSSMFVKYLSDFFDWFHIYNLNKRTNL